MIKLNYITTDDKRYIKNYCKIQMEQGDLIRPKSVMCLLEDKYSVNEVITYIKNDLGIDLKYIFHGEADYIVKLPRGHVQLVNDVYFNNCYLHQYVVAKELDLSIGEVQKYIVHHMDMDKGNNNISNLWIFFDRAIHLSYHQAIKHNPNIDIKQFTENYIESIITDKNSMEIKQYLKILDKLQKAKKSKKNAYLSSHLSKHIG